MKDTTRAVRPAIAALAFVMLAASAALAQDRPGIQGSDPPHKVRLDFNRWHDSAELYADMRAIAEAYPKFVKVESTMVESCADCPRLTSRLSVTSRRYQRSRNGGA